MGRRVHLGKLLLASMLLAGPSLAHAGRQATTLLEDARRYEAAADWAHAASTYERLEKLGGTTRGRAVYGRAWVAFQQGDFEHALDLAARASNITDAPREDARLLYGDSLFRKLDYQRAKGIYVVLYRRQADEVRKKAIARRIAEVNAALKLAADDGL